MICSGEVTALAGGAYGIKVESRSDQYVVYQLTICGIKVIGTQDVKFDETIGKGIAIDVDGNGNPYLVNTLGEIHMSKSTKGRRLSTTAPTQWEKINQDASYPMAIDIAVAQNGDIFKIGRRSAQLHAYDSSSKTWRIENSTS
jgi:hypothetical protein